MAKIFTQNSTVHAATLTYAACQFSLCAVDMFCDVIVFQVIMLVITIILGRNSKRKEGKKYKRL